MRGVKHSRIWLSMMIVIGMSTLVSMAQEAKKRNYAVVGLKNAEGVSAGEADIIADRLRIELFNTGAVSMMERDQMQEILSEQGFQQSGACTDEACMVEIGQVLGVERLISGSIGKLGSMFLLNFRSIDVQTAKIIKVVSKDVPGGIEDVVKLLPDIARQLVGEAKQSAPAQEAPPVVATPAPVKEEVKPESEPEPVVAPVVEAPKEEVVESGGDGKNKNRGGVRISYNYFFGDVRGVYVKNPSNDEFIKITSWRDKDFYDSLSDVDGFSSVYYVSMLSRIQVNFMIKAGPFIVIDVGPGLMIWNNSSGYKHEYISSSDFSYVYETDDWEFKIFAPNISLGVNFVKRFHPLKVNVGFLLDINFNILKTSEEYSNTSTSSIPEINRDFDFKVTTSFGPRVGLELLAGEHFGFSTDFLVRWSSIETGIDLYEGDSATWKFKLPLIGIGAGINFYK